MWYRMMSTILFKDLQTEETVKDILYQTYNNHAWNRVYPIKVIHASHAGDSMHYRGFDAWDIYMDFDPGCDRGLDDFSDMLFYTHRDYGSIMSTSFYFAWPVKVFEVPPYDTNAKKPNEDIELPTDLSRFGLIYDPEKDKLCP